MDKIEEILDDIHSELKFLEDENIKWELPEQLMIVKHILPTDSVLELGGSIGRASCVINYILDNKINHVVVEPNLDEAEKLEKNRALNSFGFQVEKSAISSIPLYSKGELKRDKEFVLKKLGFSDLEFDELMNSTPVNHDFYQTDRIYIEPLLKLASLLGVKGFYG